MNLEWMTAFFGPFPGWLGGPLFEIILAFRQEHDFSSLYRDSRRVLAAIDMGVVYIFLLFQGQNHAR